MTHYRKEIHRKPTKFSKRVIRTETPSDKDGPGERHLDP